MPAPCVLFGTIPAQAPHLSPQVIGSQIKRQLSSFGHGGLRHGSVARAPWANIFGALCCCLSQVKDHGHAYRRRSVTDLFMCIPHCNTTEFTYNGYFVPAGTNLPGIQMRDKNNFLITATVLSPSLDDDEHPIKYELLFAFQVVSVADYTQLSAQLFTELRRRLRLVFLGTCTQLSADDRGMQFYICVGPNLVVLWCVSPLSGIRVLAFRLPLADCSASGLYGAFHDLLARYVLFGSILDVLRAPGSVAHPQNLNSIVEIKNSRTGALFVVVIPTGSTAALVFPPPSDGLCACPSPLLQIFDTQSAQTILKHVQRASQVLRTRNEPLNGGIQFPPRRTHVIHTENCRDTRLSHHLYQDLKYPRSKRTSPAHYLSSEHDLASEHLRLAAICEGTEQGLGCADETGKNGKLYLGYPRWLFHITVFGWVFHMSPAFTFFSGVCVMKHLRQGVEEGPGEHVSLHAPASRRRWELTRVVVSCACKCARRRLGIPHPQVATGDFGCWVWCGCDVSLARIGCGRIHVEDSATEISQKKIPQTVGPDNAIGFMNENGGQDYKMCHLLLWKGREDVWGLQEEEGREEGRVWTSCRLRRSFRRPRAPRQTTGRRTVPVGLAVIVVRAGRPDARRSGSGYDDFAVRAHLGAGACPARRYWAARRTSIARRWGTRYGGIRSSACDSRANTCPLCRYGGKSDVRSGAGYGEGFPRCSVRHRGRGEGEHVVNGAVERGSRYPSRAGGCLHSLFFRRGDYGSAAGWRSSTWKGTPTGASTTTFGGHNIHLHGHDVAALRNSPDFSPSQISTFNVTSQAAEISLHLMYAIPNLFSAGRVDSVIGVL
ncbi:hypothetical protein B0H16DRAFT_1828731 [Mycena metata]|uniref:Uncharacterized protein n=1 Tax=Mycena metata TaxID=1033252 RepID=A0AAD7NCU5_9AGAR|nr:hypothetical protein B0H16DRAFT_1828731 [Mycena metata]